MNTLVSNVLEMVNMQYEINAISDYLKTCPLDASNFMDMYESWKIKTAALTAFKQSTLQ